MTDRILWGIGTARTQRAHWALCELGLDYESRKVLPRTPAMEAPDFRAVSPRKKVPILQEGDLVVGESGAIVLHVADRHRSGLVLSPEIGSDERSVFHDRFHFVLTEIDSPLYVIRMHEGLSDVYGEAPNAVAAARDYFARQAGEMERVLSDGRPHLMDDAFSAVDVLLVSCLQWARILAIPLSDTLETYTARVAARPAFAEANARNFPPEAVAWLKAGAGRGGDA